MKKSQWLLFRQEILKRHQSGIKLGDRSHHKQRKNKGSQSPSWKITPSAKFSETGDSHETGGKFPFTLTALAYPTHFFFRALEIRPNVFCLAHRAGRESSFTPLLLYSAREWRKIVQGQFHLTLGDHIIPQSCELGFPEVFPSSWLLPQRHIFLN